MDHDIHFGEVEQVEPTRRLRPDRNGHYRVAAIGDVSENDLPIFIDLDTICDIEFHAFSDTRVELGGVLLGGQYEDSDGRPFVVVSESIRAEHFEATRGSFKFTHDTWEQITRQRQEFPADLQMVGWYHTHPDWGVFLSGMDLFICENFFNKPLDLALVVDPCRGDRGFFVWTKDSVDPIRRTGSFFVFASRHRHNELSEFAADLEASINMSTDLRRTSGTRNSSSAATPIVHIDSSTNTWQWTAMMASLAMQFCFMTLLAWKLLVPSDVETVAKNDSGEATKEFLRRLDVDRQVAEVKAEKQLLDRLVSRWDGTPKPFLDSLMESQKLADELKSHVIAHQAHERELERIGAKTQIDLSDSQGREQTLVDDVARLEEQIAALKQQNAEQREWIHSSNDSLAGDTAVADKANWYYRPAVWGGIVAVCFFVVGGYLVVRPRRLPGDQYESSQEPSV